MAIAKDFLNLAGEYRVCAELLKRQLFATITYGNKKGVDIFAIGDNRRRVAVVEVKASQKKKFLTRIYQKYREHPDPNCTRPDFWVLYLLRETAVGFEERFFILSHDELAAIQAQQDRPGQTLTYNQAADLAKNGVDNVRIENVEGKDATGKSLHEDRWDKIIDFCRSSPPATQP